MPGGESTDKCGDNHESVFDRPVENHRRHIVYVAANLSTDLKDYIVDTSKVSELLRVKP